MVLPEASGSNEPDPFSSDASQEQPPPPSDQDPYAGDRNPTILPSRDSSYFLAAPGIYINKTDLPKPLWSRGELSQVNIQSLQRVCQERGELIGRPLRQDEAEAIIFLIMKANRTVSYTVPIGTALGLLMAYRGNKKQPLSIPRLGQFTRIPRIGRYFLYPPLAATATFMVGASYAGTVMAVQHKTDPRLKDFTAEWEAKLRQGRLGKTPGGRQVDETPGQRSGETFEMARQRQGVQRMQQEVRAKRSSTIDDMSPTGGSFGDEFLDTSNSSGNELMSDSQLATRQQNDRPTESAQRAPSQRSGANNASPTVSSGATSTQGGSAWDRLREQALSGQGQASSNTPKPASNGADGSSTIDNFAFSTADEERERARIEAQKEFDARMERERAGKNFDDGNGKGGWKS